jgi:hypothetical protein
LLLSVWSPQPASRRLPATATAPTAAIRDRVAVVRRVVLAVMSVFLRQGMDSGRKGGPARTFECRDLV